MIIVEEVNIKDFKTIYNDMTVQFPETEMKSYKKFLNLLGLESYKLFAAYSDGVPIGYSLINIDPKNKVLWLDYIAIFKNFQSKGYGKEVFCALKKKFSNFKGIYLEVEKADEKNPDTKRRIKFYEKLGAQKLSCKYIYPNSDGGLEMDLYFLSINSFLPEPSQIRDAVLEAFKTLHSDILQVDDIFQKIVF